MKTNMGKADRIIRIVVALIFAILYFTDTVPGTTGLVLMILAIVFAATSFIGFCPLYLPFNINTKSKSESQS
ncbi:MAG: membrane protein [Bacteroidia bacterium]|nr:MAG: membrane protein [Bacteroidia bacterium]